MITRICTLFLVALLVFGVLPAEASAPADNPTAEYGLEWTDSINWGHVIDIHSVEGEDWTERLEKAQDRLGAEGGVVYFPTGEYRFEDSVHIEDGVVLRGAAPEDYARSDDYSPTTRFEFPRYEPTFEGEGTPNNTAFKGIYLREPAQASNCGVVNISINHGHILFGRDNPEKGVNRLIYGCVLRNAALIAERVPDLEKGQHPWQRFTKWHQAAIDIRTFENALVANNRLPESDGNFLMRDYIIEGRGKYKGQAYPVKPGVWFDYDNRPGISVNLYSLGGGGGRDPKHTPETYSDGFRKGIIIRDNFIYSTGRSAIGFSGDGTICANNVVRFPPDVRRWTNTGVQMATGSSTNDNRAILVRGWRWTVEDNDYTVYRNQASDSGYYINDGEGIMHEGHANCRVKDSRLIGNKGNAYISIYLTAGIDGLLIKGNDIRPFGPGTDRKISSIFVNANRNYDKHYCRNVRIIDNVTMGSGIKIAGEPGENNLVARNRNIGAEGKIINEANAKLEDNENYEVVEPE